MLVVEDEASILKLAQRILESSGYTILISSTLCKAAALAEDHAGDVRLPVTDAAMPEMNGRELAKILQTNYPAIKVLFISVCTANSIAHRRVLNSGVNFIQKSIVRSKLTVKVRQAIG